MLVDRIVKETTDISRDFLDMSWWLDEGETITSVVSQKVILGAYGWSDAPYPLQGGEMPYDPFPLEIDSAVVAAGGTQLEVFVSEGSPSLAYTCQFVLDGSSTRRVTIEMGVQVTGVPLGALGSGPLPSYLAVTIADTPPSDPQPGQLWFDSIDPQLYIWYDDPSSSQWVIVTSDKGGLATDAPYDGGIYSRQNGVWVLASGFGNFLPLTGGVLTRVDAPGTPSVPVLRINYTGGGSSNGALMVNVAATDGNAFPWGITSNLVVTQSGSGQPVGITSAVQRKSGNATSFCYYAEFRDLTGLSQQGTSVLFEQDLFANGPEGVSTYWAPGSGSRAAMTLALKNQDHPDWAPITNYNQGDVINPVLVYGPGDNPPVTGTGTTWSAYCYIAQNTGTSGSVAPAWPTTQGNTVSDGTITWVCGTTYQGQFSRGLSIGGSLGSPPINARRMPNVAAALIFGNMNIYNAVIDMSGSNLKVAAGLNPNGDGAVAAIRLSQDWPIDFSGGNFNNQNQRTLKYNSTSNALEFTLFGKVVFSIEDADNGAVLVNQVLAVGGVPAVAAVQAEIGGSNTVGIRTSNGTFTTALRMGSDQKVSFDGSDVHYLQYRAATQRLYYVVGGVDMWSVDASGNVRAKGTLTGSTTP